MVREPRILLIEDDVSLGGLYRAWLETAFGAGVEYAQDGNQAVTLLESRRFDLIVSDMHLPGSNGVLLTEQAKAVNPRVPVLIITADAGKDAVIAALRARADDYLLKPFDASSLSARARCLLTQQAAKREQRTILAVGAHPDDVELGVGAMLARHVDAGHRVVILTLSGGEHGGEVGARALEAREAATRLGAELVLCNLPDTKIKPENETIGIIEQAVRRLLPCVVLTHSLHDNHQDHRAVHRATMIAARSVGNVFCYQSPSSANTFLPAAYIPVGRYLDDKLAAIHHFASQSQRSYLSDEVIRSTATYWGRFSSNRACEPLEVVRVSDYQLPTPHASEPSPSQPSLS